MVFVSRKHRLVERYFGPSELWTNMEEVLVNQCLDRKKEKESGKKTVQGTEGKGGSEILTERS